MTLISGTLDARWICDVAGGSLSGNADARINSGWSDSRLCRSGSLFVAVKGENEDGSRYVGSAWDHGADIALVADDVDVPEPPEGKALIRVPEVLSSLQDIAREIRRSRTGLKVVGITGSNGKTTTKDILAAIVRQRWADKALVTRGNYNSDIGLSLMLLELNSRHEVAILEMGMNRKGEMAELASIACPDIAIITNVGTAHIGILGSEEAIAAEKRSIFDNASFESTAIVGSDEKWADFLLESYPGNIRRFGHADTNGWDLVENLGLEGFLLARAGRDIRFTLPGVHNLLNAMAAVEAALALGVSEEEIALGLESVIVPGGRSDVHRGAVTVIRDGYNANPESLNAAFELFKNASTDGRRVLVLGEMLELGEETDRALIAAGGAAAKLGPDGIFLFGASLGRLQQAASDAGYSGLIQVFTEMDKLKEALGAYLVPGDLILLKGSRGSALERLDDMLERIGSD